MSNSQLTVSQEMVEALWDVFVSNAVTPDDKVRSYIAYSGGL